MWYFLLSYVILGLYLLFDIYRLTRAREKEYKKLEFEKDMLFVYAALFILAPVTLYLGLLYELTSFVHTEAYDNIKTKLNEQCAYIAKRSSKIWKSTTRWFNDKLQRILS